MKRIFMSLFVVSLVLAGCAKRDSEVNDCSSININTSTDEKDVGIRYKNIIQGVSLDHLAQSFKAPSNASLTKVSVNLKLNGTIPDAEYYNVTLRIVDNSSGMPDSNLTVGGSTVSSSIKASNLTNGDNVFSLSSAVSITSGTTYWVVLSADYPQSSVDYISWNAYQGSSNNYSDGSAWYYDLNTGSFSNTLIGSLRDFMMLVYCTNNS